MYNGYKIVVNTAAGRRRYMQYLIPFVVACDIVDRYDIWVNTHDGADIEFFRRIADRFPKVNLVWQPDGIVDGIKSINAFYKSCVDADTIYFKMDDDIVWIEPGAIEEMVRFRVDNPNYFLVSPLVINNALSTYLLQVCDKLHLYAYQNSSANHNLLWKSGEFASQLHRWFIDNYLATGRWAELHVGTHPMAMTRFSINAVLWFGSEMAKFGGIVPGDDEEFLSCIYPSRMGMANCWNGDAIFAHFAFFTQRKQLDADDILPTYGRLLHAQWANDSRMSAIDTDVQSIMKQIADHAVELGNTPSPYRRPDVSKTKSRINEFKMSIYRTSPDLFRLLSRIRHGKSDTNYIQQ